MIFSEDLIPQWFILMMLGLAGLSFGSFVTLVSWRLPRGEPIVRGRSRCPSCEKTLGVATLFPVLSWLVQGGKCRYCKSKVSARYPATELVQAAFFYAIYAQIGITLPSIILMLASVAILVLIVVDFEWYIIPDEIQIALLVLGLAFHAALGANWEAVLMSAALGLGIGLALRFGYSLLMRREGLGWGDVKFLPIAGIWLAQVADWPPFLFYSGVLGIATALVWRALGKGAHFPFGPALALSLLLDVLYDAGLLFYWTLMRLYA